MQFEDFDELMSDGLYLVDFNLWEGVNPRSGIITDVNNPYFNCSISGRLLICESFNEQIQDEGVVLELVRNGCPPAGFVSSQLSPHIISGIAIAEVLYGYRIPYVLSDI